MALPRPTGYGWIVDVDHLDDSDIPGHPGRDVGTTGPRSAHPQIIESLKRGDRGDGIVSWRCKDDDGELYYEGRYIGPMDESLFGPLWDFAQPNAGATSIEWLNPASGQWERV